MMRAMPYNLQGKGVAELSGLISQISSSLPPNWKTLDNFQEQQQQQQISEGEEDDEEEDFEKQAALNIPKKLKLKLKQKQISATQTSSVDSEPTSTLDTTSPPTSTSTLSSSFTNGQHSGNKDISAGVADPSCARKEDWPSELNDLHQGSDNVTAASSAGERLGGGSGGGGGGIGLEDWDALFPTGDGALLPWIIGDAEDPSLGLKHLLQSGTIVDYEGNAGLGDVDQGPGFDTHSMSPPRNQPQLLPHHPLAVVGNEGNGGSANFVSFIGSEFGNNGKIGLISPNCSSGVSNNGGLNTTNSLILGSIPANFQHQFEVGDEKPQIFNPQLVMNQQQAQSPGNPSFFMPPWSYCQLDQHLLQPPTKRHNPGVVLDPNLVSKNPFHDQGHDLLMRKQQVGFQQFPMGLPPQLVPPHLQQKQMMVPKLNHQQQHQHQHQHQQHFPLPGLQHQHQLQEQAIKDQLFKAADLILTGNFSLAQEILARLNHQLSLPAKPLIRAALYVKEALQMLLLTGNPVAAPPSKTLTPYDVVHKMNAYKLFSEVSPITQFTNFTCTQAILEALDDADAIHIIDFDVGCGAQWASLIQELPLRKRGAPSLKITALAPSSSHPFELGLIRENLMQFANDIGIAFDLQVVNLDLFDPSSCSLPNFRTSEDESIAVSIPIWSSSNRPSMLPPILEFIKQCSPKIVVSLDRVFDRCDVPFPQHLVHTLDWCTNFLESLDGLNVASDIVNKVEKFFVQPRIENTVLGRVHFPEKMSHWKNLFASAGFSPMQFSNFTETQADYVVKRTPGRGFHVEKRQASLVLSWQRRELVAASAWRY
ncbi:scarecrow-like protein 6 [Spinacia oleracea]|uniref:Scarecrow-like protein 6 n=1 Tax=Spinacia oleracea TaxID=3562 RepID=A0A9R0IP56_SPIOL|nr:scarecrow-like protein 6 [Spinacia oleracea]